MVEWNPHIYEYCHGCDNYQATGTFIYQLKTDPMKRQCKHKRICRRIMKWAKDQRFEMEGEDSARFGYTVVHSGISIKDILHKAEKMPARQPKDFDYLEFRKQYLDTLSDMIMLSNLVEGQRIHSPQSVEAGETAPLDQRSRSRLRAIMEGGFKIGDYVYDDSCKEFGRIQAIESNGFIRIKYSGSFNSTGYTALSYISHVEDGSEKIN